MGQSSGFRGLSRTDLRVVRIPRQYVYFALAVILLSVAACSENGASLNTEVTATAVLSIPEGESMQTVMVQFRHSGPEPSIDVVRELFGLDMDEIDAQFGVIATDPDEGLYTVLVAADAIERVEAVLAERPPDSAEGVFANPRRSPLGHQTTERPNFERSVWRGQARVS